MLQGRYLPWTHGSRHRLSNPSIVVQLLGVCLKQGQMFLVGRNATWLHAIPAEIFKSLNRTFRVKSGHRS